MSDHYVIISEDKYRVVAQADEFPSQPEHMGWPEVIIGWDRFSASVSTSWSDTVDEDSLLRAFEEFGDSDTFARWVRIFAEELVDFTELDFDDDELADGVVVQVGHAHGYSQGDKWIVLQWRPKKSEVWDSMGFDPDASELVNWARGDAWFLKLQKKVTWTTDDDEFGDREEWETVDALHGFYTQYPDESEWVLEEAEGMIPNE